MTIEADRGTVDWLDADFNQDPYPHFQRWRDQAPIAWSAAMGGYFVTRYDDVKHVLTTPRVYSQSEFFEAAFEDMFQRKTLVNLDPPEHTELRKQIADYFRPSTLQEQMTEIVGAIADDLVTEAAQLGTFELRADVSSKLTMRVMSVLMGTDDSAAMKGLYQACMTYVRTARSRVADPEVRQRGKEAGDALMSYLRGLIEDSCVARPDGMVGAFSRRALGVDMALAVAGVVLLAGVETTIGGLGNTFFALYSEHQEALPLIRGGQYQGAHAFEEGLRWMSPLSLKARQVRTDESLHGVDLHRGDLILASVGSANRDPRRYQDPEEFDLGRRNKDHLAFGTGAHYCLGAPLARLEGGMVVDKFVSRLPSLHVKADFKVRFGGGPVYRSPEELWLEV